MDTIISFSRRSFDNIPQFRTHLFSLFRFANARLSQTVRGYFFRKSKSSLNKL